MKEYTDITINKLPYGMVSGSAACNDPNTES
jgi:hypothetical protein